MLTENPLGVGGAWPPEHLLEATPQKKKETDAHMVTDAIINDAHILELLPRKTPFDRETHGFHMSDNLFSYQQNKENLRSDSKTKCVILGK